MSALTMLLGTIVGLSLGLTGGGGAIFAVPLLVYAVGMTPRQAIEVSLLTVGLTALIGFVQRARQGLVEYSTGMMFATAGMLGAPVGAYVANFIPEPVLLIAFACLMLGIAVKMWFKQENPFVSLNPSEDTGPVCHRDAEGKLHWTSPCALLLASVGLGTGCLSGMFGVGGGFIIVPALVTFSCMSMKRAVSTSLLVMALISASGIASFWWVGRPMPLEVAAQFSVGSVIGLLVGTQLAQRLSGLLLQRLFAGAIVTVAIVVLFQAV